MPRLFTQVQAPEDRVLPSATEADAMIRAQWSAPLFIKAHLFGIGIALGYMKIQSRHGLYCQAPCGHVSDLSQVKNPRTRRLHRHRHQGGS